MISWNQTVKLAELRCSVGWRPAKTSCRPFGASDN
ncbi:hypothetical protein D039_3891A, partial [Vibrio parahaemolyticus EKP-028]